MATKTKQADGIALSVDTLKMALAVVRDAVADRSPRPILRNVLISGGQVIANNLELQVTTAIPFDGPALLLPHGRLVSILHECRSGEVRITPPWQRNDSSCVIKTASSSWTLPTEDVGEYPQMQADGAKPRIKLPADQFARSIWAVVDACDKQSSRYALGGVLVEVAGDKVSFVATDGRRLNVAEAEHDLAVDDSQTLIPERVARLLARLADAADGEEVVDLEATDNTLVCTIGGTVVTARLVDGRFPRWRDVFPKHGAAATVVDRQLLAAAIRAARITTSESSKGVDFAFSAEGLWLHSQSSEAGESSVTCAVVQAGNVTSVKLDPEFVLDFLAGLSGEAEPHVEISAAKAGDAVLLTCGDVRGVIMPLAAD